MQRNRVFCCNTNFKMPYNSFKILLINKLIYRPKHDVRMYNCEVK